MLVSTKRSRKIIPVDTMMRTIKKVKGRVVNKKILKTIGFLEILTPQNEIQLITAKDTDILNEIKEIRRGSIIEVEGDVKLSLSKKYPYEIVVKKIKVLARNYNEKLNIVSLRESLPKYWTPTNNVYFLVSNNKKILSKLRSYVMYKVHDFFYRVGFVEVHSPKIVGKIVRGPTIPFVVDYYKRKKYLSISNVLYHHILIILGYDRIFEVSPLFRQEKYESKYQLTEFWVLDFSESWSGREKMMKTLEKLLYDIFTDIPSRLEQKLQKENIPLPNLPDHIEKIEYDEILKWLNIHKDDYGTHLPQRLTKLLEKRKIGLLWIINAPYEKKPFFIKRKGKKALNAELWTDRVPILASGGERVTDYKEAINNIISLKLDPEDFKPYLEILKFGAPPSYTIGMGIERLLQYMTNLPLYYLVLFPRFADSEFYL